ncbi:1,2-phenylacetyl-CoA epoxidase subunit PaaC [Corynebacterium cystitidis]|uniref:Ring-1,2-phenylacetyl-CoA epoxidase subunit PaaC n=1 Tax=Corynebacterium cystitidis DSM 20524 TaxID=1121357 RepID=A0A1H9TR32_9CORY|nr:1,2-phenylacetyl-CoA epoxidase subunit PaaC [Corynebacterium cystitidis]WJY82004.1 1,2-phenylacetyl-CoA epoxidase, subunit C [Corynebacterium cystitidis DSM 20524]SER99123.1 ring-1,2-phenylacetyl-CoA epoxidase subunit PaaC [Corynebacterium cystitidis DSM 20524]SNV80969.1 phenylacetate-CoA oxygenase subunit PaaI [Corynebacterium cystitidis]
MSYATNDSATKQSQGDAITPEDVVAAGAIAPEKTAEYAAMLGDDALMLAQRLSWWVSRAPEMEEDIALANIALDLIGHTRFLYSYAGTAWDKSEDDLAYFRDEEEFRSAAITEQENGDFGQTIARQLLISYYMFGLYTGLEQSTDQTLAAIAAKAVKELEYHVDHANQWMLRLGQGTEESHRRVSDGLRYMWPYVDELFEDLPIHNELADEGIAVLPSSLRAEFDTRIEAVLDAAGVAKPEVPQSVSAQRTGRYSEHRGFILAEMQSLARQHPGVTW